MFGQKMGSATTFWAIFSQTQLVTLLTSPTYNFVLLLRTRLKNLTGFFVLRAGPLKNKTSQISQMKLGFQNLILPVYEKVFCLSTTETTAAAQLAELTVGALFGAAFQCRLPKFRM
jgi:hypothetical protein